jgi:hypothetical protein
MVLEFADGSQVEVPAGTPSNGLCAIFPEVPSDNIDPCYIAAQVNSSGVSSTLHVFAYGKLHETDVADSIFTATSDFLEADAERLVLEDGTWLLVSSDIAISCGSVTEVSDLAAEQSAGYHLILDPSTGEVTSIECLREF